MISLYLHSEVTLSVQKNFIIFRAAYLQNSLSWTGVSSLSSGAGWPLGWDVGEGSRGWDQVSELVSSNPLIPCCQALSKTGFLFLALRPERAVMSAWPTTRLGARVSMLWPDAACLPGPTAASTQLCQLGLLCRPTPDAPSRALCSQVGGWAHPGVRSHPWLLVPLLASGWSHAGVQLSGAKASAAPSIPGALSSHLVCLSLSFLLPKRGRGSSCFTALL